MSQLRKLLVLAAALTSAQIMAQEKPATSAKPAQEPTLKERFENLGLIYQDKQAKGLQELWLLGR